MIRWSVLFVVMMPVSLAAAPIERPLKPVAEATAVNFAHELLQLSEMLASQYAREVSPADLVLAALQGLYETARQPFPTGLAEDIKRTKETRELLPLIAEARRRVGNSPALEGLKATYACVFAIPRALDPYCGLVPATDFSTASDYSIGYGFELDGEVGAPNGIRRSDPMGGFGLPATPQTPPIPFRIARVHPGSPAQRAGMRPGDVISRVNDREVTPEASTEIHQAILNGTADVLNPRDTTFTVLRDGKTPLNIAFAKRIYHPESVFGVQRREDNGWEWWLDREAKIAYIRIGAIDPRTPSQLADALDQLRDAQGLILDLRWCPGGFLNPSAEIAGLFMGTGKIATVKYRNPNQQGASEFNAGVGLNRVRLRGVPILVLVNGDTSGGGELIACALQDNERAKVAGQRTLGKASVQTPVYLNNLSAWTFRLTAGTFFRPSGKNLQRFPDSKKEDDWGVKPDKGMEIPISAALVQRLKGWHDMYVLRPGRSREAMPLDDPEADTQRESARRLLLKLIKQ